MIKSKLFVKKIRFLSEKYYSGTRTPTSIAEVFKNNRSGDEIQIQGWVKSVRKMKESRFFDVSDGSCARQLQVVVPRDVNLTTGSSVTARGILNTTPKGQLELKTDDVKVLGECVISDGYPFAPRKEYPPEYIRQYLHLRPRTTKFSSLLRIRDAVSMEIHNHLHSEGFTNVHTPILTSNDCEGAGEVFSIRPDSPELVKSMAKSGVSTDEAYFDSKVFLTVSGQLHLETVVHGLSKVYTFGPTFRAENSRTRHHLSEFYMLEAEIAFINKIEELILVIEKLIKSVTRKIFDKCTEDLNVCLGDGKIDLSWVDKSFHIINFDEAVKILNNNQDKYKKKFCERDGFGREHEIFLVNHCGGVPVFVVNWPKNFKPFYAKECLNDETRVAALDLLVPNIGEIVGGSLREDNFEKLKERLPEGVNLDWYLELRKFGGVPTGGFGLGFERYLQLILGVDNIKDTIPFPRWPHNCKL